MTTWTDLRTKSNYVHSPIGLQAVLVGVVAACATRMKWSTIVLNFAVGNGPAARQGEGKGKPTNIVCSRPGTFKVSSRFPGYRMLGSPIPLWKSQAYNRASVTVDRGSHPHISHTHSREPRQVDLKDPIDSQEKHSIKLLQSFVPAPRPPRKLPVTTHKLLTSKMDLNLHVAPKDLRKPR